ncbi:MAG: F0F1 ATP synthase subunit A [Patescibacteria group bacterium]
MIHISLKAEEIFHIGSFPVTNSLLVTFIVSAILITTAIIYKSKLKLLPGKLQNIGEMVIEEMLDLMDSVLGSRHKSEKYLPLIATIFIFIVFSNWFGLLPIVGSLGLNENHDGEHKFTPLLRSPAADLNFTLALAIISVVMINIFAIREIGFASHGKKFFNFSNPINFFIGILELISEIAKIISFSFRLFGNVFAGEVLLIIIGFLVPYFIPLPFLLLEIFVGFIQAFVFAMLSLVFVAIATAEHAPSGHQT